MNEKNPFLILQYRDVGQKLFFRSQLLPLVLELTCTKRLIIETSPSNTKKMESPIPPLQTDIFQ